MSTQPELPTAAAPPLIEFTLIPKGTLIKPEAALTIEQAFAPYLQQFRELSAHTDEITDPKEAKVTRLKLRKVRTDTDKKHQELKADSLNYGRTLDAAKNLINGQIEPIEAKLEAIEKAEERRVAEILAARKKSHLEQLRPYLEAGMPEPFVDNITDEQFARMLENAKTLQQAKIERQQKEERERLEREQKEREEKERLRLENERLQREAEEAEERAQKERLRVAAEKMALEDKHAAELAEQERKRAEERKAEQDRAFAAAEKIRKEKAAADAKLKKEREAAEAKLAEERRQREELEAQQRRATEAENNRRQEEERRKREDAEAAERAAAAPDKEKIIAFCKALFAIPLPAVTSKRAKNLLRECGGEIQDQINTLEVEASKL